MVNEKENCVEIRGSRVFLYKDTGEVYVGLSPKESKDARLLSAEVYVDVDENGCVVGLSVFPLEGISNLIF